MISELFVSRYNGYNLFSIDDMTNDNITFLYYIGLAYF